MAYENPSSSMTAQYTCSVVCTCPLVVKIKKKWKFSLLYLNAGCLYILPETTHGMGPLTKNGSWSAGTGNRATGWGTPSGSARPRSCAPGRCSGIVLSWSRRRNPRGRRPNSRPPNHRQVLGQSLQRFTAWFRDRHKQKQTLQVLWHLMKPRYQCNEDTQLLTYVYEKQQNKETWSHRFAPHLLHL